MDDDEDIINICSELWNDLENSPENTFLLKFNVPISPGFRFRYQSEIDKKSYSLLKGEKNSVPVINVLTLTPEALLQIELVTEKECGPHFNMLYEVTKDKHPATVQNGICYIPLQCGNQNVKLESLGIRKMKIKEAISKIKELYPNVSEVEAKTFFNKHKDVVRVKVTLCQFGIPACHIFSDPIKSQISKDNKVIKIKHFSPKTVAESGEQLIIVLEKKITTEEFEATLYVDNKPHQLSYVEHDGQTFVFNLPKVNCDIATNGKFVMRCGEYDDSKSIRFLPIITEARKRKIFEHFSNNVPLKRSTPFENRENITQPLYMESGKGEELQTDCSHHPMEYTDQIPTSNVNIRTDNDSCKDSGCHSGDRSSDTNSIDNDSSSDDSDSDCIDVDGFRRQKDLKSLSQTVIHVPFKRRSNDSRLDSTISNEATKKILSEVARIGHDFAFGKNSTDLFDRIENQLPVVFTLQDDVGDTPLNNAILKGNVKQAYKILDIVKTQCDWALDLVNTSGHSALILAPACDVPADFIIKLLEAGCRLDLWDDTGKSAIVYAIEYKNAEALKVLLNHVSATGMKSAVSRFTKSYYTPLQIAIMNGFTVGVKMLLELKDVREQYLVDVNEIGLMNDETALHIAVSHECDMDIITMLLNRPDIDINQPLSNQTTALHVAIKMKLIGISNLLKSYNAIDLPNGSETDTVIESDDDIEEDNIEEMDLSSPDVELTTEIKQPVLEMSVESQHSRPTNVTSITDAMGKLSLKGQVKTKLIDILFMTDGPKLNIEDLIKIVKPTFKTIFNKSSRTTNKALGELVDHFNCLPNSVGQLFQALRKIGRLDMVVKIEKNLTNVSL